MSKYLLFFLFLSVLFRMNLKPYAGESLFVLFSIDSVMSTFDIDDEGWTVSGDAQGSSVIPNYNASGGNPDGYISAQDNVTGGVWYWKAPAKFLGDISSTYGNTVSFDLRQSSTASQFDAADVILEGGGLKLVFNTLNNPATDWTSYEVLLTESAGWKIETLDGVVPTVEQMNIVLSALTALYIRGEFVTGSDRGDLDNVILRGIVTGFEEDPVKHQAVRDFILYQNYPNPFNPRTTIEFSIPKTSEVTLKVFNVRGEEITTLVSESLPVGKHIYNWDVSHQNGVPSGVYIYVLTAGSYIKSKKMILMK